MFDYEFQDTARKLDLKRLLTPLLAAEQAMARLDDRLVCHDACAVNLLDGHLVPVEHLVQFEAGRLQNLLPRTVGVPRRFSRSMTLETTTEVGDDRIISQPMWPLERALLMPAARHGSQL